MSQNRQLVASLRQALRQNGVEDADVLTSDFAIHRERGRSPSGASIAQESASSCAICCK